MADDADLQGLVDALSIEEKIELVHGAADPEGTATGYVPGVERFGVPPLRLADGPLGVRVPGEPATAFPAPIGLAATFDTELAERHGVALGREARGLGQDAILGPGVNLIRVPHCGRNFEYYSEDPVLTASFARAVVEGIQSEDVVATPKHYVANNQESNRASVSAEVGERALRECYLPGFEAAVDAGAGSVMAAYNRVNGVPMGEHRTLLTGVLKEEWGFDGYVVSDWFAVTDAVGAANAGIDLEMPGVTREEMLSAWGFEPGEGGLHESEAVEDGMPGPSNADRFEESLEAAVRAGDVPEERLDDMAGRILGQMERIGALDGDRDGGRVGTREHRELARTIAARGAVLLENDGTLPIEDDADVAVLGPGVRDAMLGGGGSSEMEALEEVPTTEGIRDRASGDVSVAEGVPGVERVSFFGGREEEASEGAADADLDAAAEAARAADVAVVVVHDAATEGRDRETLRLPGRQDELVQAVAESAEVTVVVVQSSGPVEMPWAAEVNAILEAWYPGQADGAALASVLYGDVDASGRLPVTFGREPDYPTAPESAHPGIGDEARYGEGVFVGYRHFDAAEVAPAYPFGHGLSYASFEYRSVHAVDEHAVSVTVENTADRRGREVVQAYVRPPESTPVDRPVRELAGFASVEVSAGETGTVELALDESAFRRYEESIGWVVDDGTYTVEVGRSSRDVRLETTTSPGEHVSPEE